VATREREPKGRQHECECDACADEAEMLWYEAEASFGAEACEAEEELGWIKDFDASSQAFILGTLLNDD
jgi:hypothetical protein